MGNRFLMPAMMLTLPFLTSSFDAIFATASAAEPSRPSSAANASTRAPSQNSMTSSRSRIVLSLASVISLPHRRQLTVQHPRLAATHHKKTNAGHDRTDQQVRRRLRYVDVVGCRRTSLSGRCIPSTLIPNHD